MPSCSTNFTFSRDTRGHAGGWLALVAGLLAGLCLVAPSGMLAAQDPAASITADELGRHVAVLAADSMQDRRAQDRLAPRRTLERTATYLAAQFRALGLRPGASTRGQSDTAGWIQWYPLPGQSRLDPAASELIFEVNAHGAAGRAIATEAGHPLRRSAATTLATGAHLATEVSWPTTLPRGAISRRGSVFLLAGLHTAASLHRAQLQDGIVLYVPPTVLDQDTAARQAMVRQLAATSQLIVVSAADSAPFAAEVRAVPQHMAHVAEPYEQDPDPDEVVQVGRWPWALTVSPEVVRECLAMEGLDLAQLRADTIPLVRRLPSTQIFLGFGADTMPEKLEAPNVVATLEGADSALKREYVIVAARMDTPAPSAGTGPSALGAAGLVALARAFSQPAGRPRRSVIFLATSGPTSGAASGDGTPGQVSAQASAGESYFAATSLERFRRRQVVVATLRVDLSGPASGDSVLVDGMADVDAAAALNWSATAHPDLRLTVGDGGTVVMPEAVPLPFVRRGIPSLYVHPTSPSRTGKRSSDPPVAFDVGYGARIARLLFYMGQALANADQRLQWSAAGRQRLLDLRTP